MSSLPSSKEGDCMVPRGPARTPLGGWVGPGSSRTIPRDLDACTRAPCRGLGATRCSGASHPALPLFSRRRKPGRAPSSRLRSRRLWPGRSHGQGHTAGQGRSPRRPVRAGASGPSSPSWGRRSPRRPRSYRLQRGPHPSAEPPGPGLLWSGAQASGGPDCARLGKWAVTGVGGDGRGPGGRRPAC